MTQSKHNANEEHTNTTADIENALEKLDIIVEKMASNKLKLNESLKLFEKGLTLIRSCQNTLNKAELKIQQLTHKEGT